MNSKPRNIICLVSRLVLVTASVFSIINILLALFSVDRLMPMGLSMTGYLTKFGIQKAVYTGSSFFSIFCGSMAVLLCAVFGLCALLAVKNRGWLTAAAVMFLVDCAGIAILIATNGYRSGYWFELAGHGVILLALLVAFFSAPRRSKTVGQSA